MASKRPRKLGAGEISDRVFVRRVVRVQSAIKEKDSEVDNEDGDFIRGRVKVSN